MTIQPTAAISETGTVSRAASARDAKLKKACQDFEGQFFSLMLHEMRKTVPTDPELGDDAHQTEIFQGMMDDKVAEQMAAHGGANDLAAQMYRQLSRQAGGQGPAVATPAVLSVKTELETSENAKR